MHESQVMDPAKIYFFNASDAEGDVALKQVLGGKGAGLAAMCKAGLPVPPGFTIPISCCKYYHEHDKQWPVGLEENIRSYVQRLEEACQKPFGAGANPLLVSVRSGAARSMPGMMDTILNCGLHLDLADEMDDQQGFWPVYVQFIKQFAHTVSGVAIELLDRTAAVHSADGETYSRETALALIEVYEQEAQRQFPRTAWDALKECIDAVFDSWNNERAIIYRDTHGLNDLEGTAVNIQSMFNSEISGIAFTANPSKPQVDEIVIESAYGLGESVVSGDVSPDRFILDGQTLEIKEQHIGHKAHMMRGLSSSALLEDIDPYASSLSNEQIKEVGQIAKKVEDYFGYAVDIEWGLENGRLALLQSREIRGLDVVRDQEVGRQAEIDRLRGLIKGKRKVWVTHNLGETLRFPTPMTWDIMSEFMSGRGGYGEMYKDFGYQPSERVKQTGFLELICGRIYVDPERAAALFWSSMPLKYDDRQILEDPNIILSAPMVFDAERADGRFLLELPATIIAMFKSRKRMKRAAANALEVFLEKAVPPYLSYVQSKRQENITSLSESELLQELDARIDRVMTQFGNESLKPGFIGGMARAKLERILTQLMGADQGKRLTQQLCSGLDGDTTVEQNQKLFEVAKGNGSLDEFIEAYGHRAVAEMELSNPRLREDQSFLLKTIARQKDQTTPGPDELHELNKQKRIKLSDEMPELLRQCGGSFLQEEFEQALHEAQTLLPYRETGKHYLMMGYELIRDVLLELGKRFEIGSDIFYLRREELTDIDAAKPSIQERKVRWQSAQRLDMPDIIDSKAMDDLGLPRQLEAKSEYKGVAIAPGSFVGTARIVYNPGEAGDLPDDCVLICPSTDPSWTALFTSIKAVIVERGGVLSHGAITARDFGIPAVSYPDICSLVKDGDKLRVDGDSGQIVVIEGDGDAE